MPELLFDNRQRAKAARLVVLGTIVWSLGWLYWSSVIAQTFGLSAGDGGSLRPPNQRFTIAALMVAVALAPLIGMLVYGRVYLTRLVRDGGEVELTSLGFVLPFRFRIPISELQESEGYEGKMSGRSGVSVDTPWITLRASGYRLPFVIDLQAELVNKPAILAVIQRGKADT
jgi:hypothetical protein